MGWDPETETCVEPDAGDLDALIGDVRLLAVDVDPAYEVFTDEQLSQFLALECWDPRLAAAHALETMAADLAEKAGVVRGLLDIRVGSEQSAAVLRARAESLRNAVVYAV